MDAKQYFLYMSRKIKCEFTSRNNSGEFRLNCSRTYSRCAKKS